MASAQEWASQNEIVVPHRENRPNAATLYKFEEDQHPTNILQARCLCDAVAWRICCSATPCGVRA